MLELRVLKTIRKDNMLQSGDHVLVAVSGGADSVALLYCLHRLSGRMNWKLAVAHFNHGIRGPEADEDEEFVRRLAAELALPFFCERAQIARQAAESTVNLEDLARKARYDFLRRTAAALGAGKIAVGHSLNDQAETVLSRLFRGSGVEGFSGIRPVLGGLIVRPLLGCSRSSIEAYLRHLNVTFREDTTNRDLKLERNRIRHELIPYLEASFNRRVVETLAREAELAREASEYLAVQSRKAYLELRKPASSGVSLPVAGLLALPRIIQKLVVRHALRECRGSLRGISMTHVLDVLALCRPESSGRRIPLPGDGLAVREFDNLILLGATPLCAPKYRYELAVPGQCEVPETGMVFRAAVAQESPRAELEPAIERVVLDAASLPNPLVIRSCLPGDRYGGPGHRKLKKLFNQARIPFRKRSCLPAVVAGEAVVWIPGVKPAKSFIARPGCSRCVVLEVRRILRGP